MRLTDYEIFPDQAVNAEGDVIEEVMMAKLEQIDLK